RIVKIQGTAKRVAFVPASNNLLVGCRHGVVLEMGVDGMMRERPELQMPNNVWSIAFSPHGDRLALAGWTDPGALLRIWAWGPAGPGPLLREERRKNGSCVPFAVFAPGNSALAWADSPEPDPSALHLLGREVERRLEPAHSDSVTAIAFSPDGR